MYISSYMSIILIMDIISQCAHASSHQRVSKPSASSLSPAVFCFLKSVKPKQEAPHHRGWHSCHACSSYSVLWLVVCLCQSQQAWSSLPTLISLSDLEFKKQFHPSAFSLSLHGSFQKSSIRKKGKQKTVNVHKASKQQQ